MEEISLKAEQIFHIGSFSVTNSLLLGFVTLIILLIIGLLLNRSLSVIPGYFQNIFEMIFEPLLDLMDNILGSREKTEKYVPLIATIFLFVMISNWMGLTPIVGPIGVKHVIEGEEVLTPIFRAPASDLNFTIFLGLLSVVMVHVFGFITLGFKRHAGKFFNFKNPVLTFAGLLELVSEFVKIVSFSFRLFGNIFAGEVLLLVIGFLVPYLVPLPFLFLEVFVGFIQALIFSMLTLVFIAISTNEEEAH